MKTKVVFEFDNIDALRAFDQQIYIGGKYPKRQWERPTIMKIALDRYAIEYCVGRIDAVRLKTERENFRIDKEMMYKNIKIESLV